MKKILKLSPLCLLFSLFVITTLNISPAFVLEKIVVVLLAVSFFPFFAKNKKITIIISLFLWLLCFSLFRVAYLENSAYKIPSEKTVQNIYISKILHQGSFQKVIAINENEQRLYASFKNEKMLELGKNYQALVMIRPLYDRANFGNFSRQKWLLSQGITAKASIYNAQLISDKNQTIRQKFFYIIKNKTKDLSYQGIILALGFGERAFLNHNNWKLFQNTATAHIIAISGLHITLVFFISLIITKFIAKLTLIFNPPLWFLSLHTHNVIALICTLFYCYLANFSTPTTRAMIAMLGLYFWQYKRRSIKNFDLWIIMVSLLLIINPLNAISTSFYLSILAVLSLIIWYHFFSIESFKQLLGNNKTTKKRSVMKFKIIRFIISLIHLQFGIVLLFTPISLIVFEGFSTYSFIANLIIVPFYSFVIVPLILISMITFDCFYTFYLSDKLIALSINILQYFDNSWLTLSYQEIYNYSIVLLLFTILLFGILHHKKIKTLQIIAVIIQLVWFSNYVFFYQKEQYQFITFDVGQGLATIFIHQQGFKKEAIIYDTGQKFGKISLSGIEVIPFLKRQNIKLQAIILSHNDSDHSGGVTDLLKAYPKALLYSSSLQKYHQKSPLACKKGINIKLGKFHFQVIYPYQIVNKAKNEDSCVVLVNIFHHKILLTGDSGKNEELLYSKNLPKIDILQVPHHGSNSSSSDLLLEKTTPKVAIISVGRFNPWKHPRKEVLLRLQKYQARIFTTPKHGAVKIIFDKDSYNIKTMRNNFAPWFHSFFTSGQ